MSIERTVREEVQTALFDIGDAWEDHWWGMPDYSMGDCRPPFQVMVNIFTVEDLAEFGRRLGLRVTRQTDTLTFPAGSIDKPSDWVYTDEA
jgi:hypothetical protein